MELIRKQEVLDYLTMRFKDAQGRNWFPLPTEIQTMIEFVRNMEPIKGEDNGLDK